MSIGLYFQGSYLAQNPDSMYGLGWATLATRVLKTFCEQLLLLMTWVLVSKWQWKSIPEGRRSLRGCWVVVGRSALEWLQGPSVVTAGCYKRGYQPCGCDAQQRCLGGGGLSWSCPLVLTGQTEILEWYLPKLYQQGSLKAQMAPTSVSNPRDHSNWFLLLKWCFKDSTY